MNPLMRNIGAAVLLAVGLAGCGSSFEPAPADSVGGPDGGGSSGSGAGGSAAGASGSAGAAPIVNPGAHPLGTSCASSDDCESGHCADGVCCDRACDGSCESCAANGACAPYAAGTDPEAECAGDGASSACAGSCNGASGCDFPGAETACGATSCAAGVETRMTCDAAGSCKLSELECGLFVCGGPSCKATCSIDSDCVAGAYCDAGTCKEKLDNGQACGAKNQCQSGWCEQGSCCASACAAPLSCSSGQCLCNGSVCTGGAQCITWYLDQDGDGFGASGPSDTLGCSSTPPVVTGKKFVQNKTDCYDLNKDAFPGQTKFFTKHRGDGSFDYDCSSSLSYQYPSTTAFACKACGQSGLGGCNTCAMGLECNSSASCSGPKVKIAFTKPTACGQSGYVYDCTANCQSIPQNYGAIQGCR